MILYLASSSPRRKAILEEFKVPFMSIPNLLKDEILREDLPLRHALRLLSADKALASQSHYRGLILSADTLISLENQIFGKPSSLEEAKKMLELLSGKTHQVISSFSLLDTEVHRIISRTVSTKITFNALSEQDISNYCLTHSPLDKSGSYGIQELPKHFINSIQGSIYNVMGLPIGTLLTILRRYSIVAH